MELHHQLSARRRAARGARPDVVHAGSRRWIWSSAWCRPMASRPARSAARLVLSPWLSTAEGECTWAGVAGE